MELEGLRGLAAIAVVLSHFVYAFYPAVMSAKMNLQHMRFEDNIHGTPLAILFAGTFAVAIFFVLSGFVLSIGFFKTGREDIIKKMAIKRYPRLMLPALVSVLLCLLLMCVGVYVIQDAAAITQSHMWLANQWNFDPNILSAIYNGTIGIFTQEGSPYNLVLWTMFTEFIGSFIIFGFLLFFGASRYRWLAYGVVAAFTFNTWFFAFIVGMLLADLYATGVLQKIKKAYLPILLVCGVLLGGYPNNGAGKTAYGFMSGDILGFSFNNSMLYLTLGATMLVIVSLLSRRVSTFLSHAKVSVLGKYTFALYLTHIPILLTFTSGVFLALNPYFGYNMAVFVAWIVSIPPLLMVAVWFEKYVDAPSIAFANRCTAIYTQKEELNIKKSLTYAKESVQIRWALFQGRIMSVLRQSTEDRVE